MLTEKPYQVAMYLLLAVIAFAVYTSLGDSCPFGDSCTTQVYVVQPFLTIVSISVFLVLLHVAKKRLSLHLYGERVIKKTLFVLLILYCLMLVPVLALLSLSLLSSI